MCIYMVYNKCTFIYQGIFILSTNTAPELPSELIWCSSNEKWERLVHGSEGDIYTVSYGLSKQGDPAYDYSCTCPGFKFRKSCRHIAEVKSERCGFGWSALAGRPEKMGEKCPVCGADTCVIGSTHPDNATRAAPNTPPAQPTVRPKRVQREGIKQMVLTRPKWTSF